MPGRSRVRIAVVFAALVLGCGSEPTGPPRGQDGYGDSAACIEGLATVYRDRDRVRLAHLLSGGTPGEPAYLHLLANPEPTQLPSRDRDMEIRYHEIFFGEQWLQGIDATFARQGDFVERQDLYQPAGEIDPDRWVAREGFYATSFSVQVVGDTDYQQNGRSLFVVLEDRTKNRGAAGKFLIYRWFELDTDEPPN